MSGEKRGGRERERQRERVGQGRRYKNLGMKGKAKLALS